MSRWTIGVDVGGTFTKLVLADRQGRAAARLVLPTRPETGTRDFLERLAAAAASLQAGGRKAGGLGLAVAGLIEARRGVLRQSPNLPGWRQESLGDRLGRLAGLPVVMTNDANAAAWGIYAAELKRRPEALAVITLGTGVGGGLVLDGRIFTGAFGFAGEIGHCTVRPGGELCACGNRGCLEAYAGGRSLVRRYLGLKRAAPELDPRLVALRARRGDARARRVFEDAGRALAQAVGNLACLLNPDAVVLAGGVSASSDLFLPALKKALAGNPFEEPRRGLRLRVSRLRDAGAVGAALWAQERRP